MSKRIRNYSITLASSLTFMLAVSPSFGSTVTYSDITSWTAATSGQTAIQFTGLAPAGSSTTYNNSTGLVLSGVTFLGYFSAASYQLAVVDSMYASPYYNFGAGASLQGPGRTTSFLPYIHVVLPSNVTGIATDLMTVSPNALPFRVTLADGETFTAATQNRPNTSFFGLTADNPIAYVDFSLPTSTVNGGTYGLLKDFQFSTGTAPGPTQTPEAATLILIGTGLVIFRYMKKKGQSLNPAQA